MYFNDIQVPFYRKKRNEKNLNTVSPFILIRSSGSILLFIVIFLYIIYLF